MLGPFVDIWGLPAERLGLSAWPQVPRDQDLKYGTFRRSAGRQRPGRIAPPGGHPGPVPPWDDLDLPLLTTVEQLIDFSRRSG